MRRLIVRPGAIGDCILCWPALEHLLTEYTEIWISSPVVSLVGFADAVRPLAGTGIDLVGLGDREWPAMLREHLQSFDSIVSWYGTNRPEFRAALAAENIGCDFLPALPPAGFTGHATDFFAGQVGAAKGSVPRINIDRAAKRQSVIIHPFSGGKRKNWRLDLFQQVAGSLDCKVEWLAGPEEALENALRFERLRDLAHWLTGASLYVGNDSGITHLAAAIGVPTLALFGPTDPVRWAPRGKDVSILREEPLEALRVEPVLEAANRLLDLPAEPASNERLAYGRLSPRRLGACGWSEEP